MTASGTVGFFISVFPDVVLPAALLERKQTKERQMQVSYGIQLRPSN